MLVRNLLRLLLLLFSLNGCFIAQAMTWPQASAPLIIDSGFKQLTSIGQHLDVYEDPSTSLVISDIAQAAALGKFKHSKLKELSIGTSSSVWWVHLTLINNTDREQQLVLEQGYAHIDSIVLWEKKGDALEQRASGDLLPFSARELDVNALPFVLTLAANSRKTFFLRYQTGGSLTVDLSLYTPVEYAQARSHRQLVQGLFYGAMFAMTLYNLFIFFIVRDRNYLLYVIYILSFGLFMASFNGYTGQYLWPEYPKFVNTMVLVSWGVLIAMTLIFSQQFLGVKKPFPKLYMAMNGLIAVSLSCSLAATFLPYASVIKVLFFMAPPSYLIILYAAYQSIKTGSLQARYFIAAWATLLMAALIGTLFNAGVLPGRASLSPYIIQIGAIVEIVLLSIALASRIRNLEQDSMTDSLTGLFNRRVFDAQLHRCVAIARRSENPMALMMVDVDHFKQFNDRFGHDQGDIVLRQVAKVLNETARESDFVFRYGGEEFAIILPNTEEENAMPIAERIRENIAALGVQEQSITVSIGISVLTRDDTLNEFRLFRQADDSLYRAKQTGRNRVVVFSQQSTVA